MGKNNASITKAKRPKNVLIQVILKTKVERNFNLANLLTPFEQK